MPVLTVPAKRENAYIMEKVAVHFYFLLGILKVKLVNHDTLKYHGSETRISIAFRPDNLLI
jgi:hypothetical protein